MLKDRGASRQWKFLLGIYGCISAFLVFYIPTVVPGRPVSAESYIFGYNNRVGFVLFIVLISVGAIFSRKLNLQFASVDCSDQVTKKTLWVCMAIALVLCVAMYVLTARIGGFGESTYLINRIELGSHGLHPYGDYEYAYGAFLIYAPILFSRTMHISIPNAYYLFWILTVVGGVWMLAAVINGIDYASKHKNTIFLLLYIFMLSAIITTGANYSGFRFLSAPLFGLIVYRKIRDAKLQSQIAGSALAILFALLLLLISPEFAIAFSLGISVYFFLFYMYSGTKSWLLPYCGMVLLLGFLMFFANKFQVFHTLKSMGSGGNNFPIIPDAQILTFFALAFVCACYLIYVFSRKEFRSNTVLILVISIPCLAGSMGRCDAGHIVFNGIGTFMVGSLILSNYPRWWKLYRGVFFVAFIVFSYASVLWFYSASIARASAFLVLRSGMNAGSSIDESLTYKIAVRHYGKQVADKKLGNMRLLLAQDATSDHIATPSELHGVAEIPFGYFATHNTTSFDGGYYFGLENAFDPKSVDSKILELAEHPDRELLLPEKYADNCHIDAKASRKLISFLFVYPYLNRAVHTDDIYAPLCNYITDHYVLIVPPQPSTYGYGIWARK